MLHYKNIPIYHLGNISNVKKKCVLYNTPSFPVQAATNESHPYQELDVAGNTYNNLTLNAS